MTLTVAFTGHRPDDLGGYGEINPIRDQLKSDLHVELISLRELAVAQGKSGFSAITGMALGFDQWAAEVCLDLDIPYMAVAPFYGQERMWTDDAQARYLELWRKAKTVKIVSPGGYSAKKMQLRNEFMADRCDVIVAAWNGKPEGGTYNTIAYAKKIGKRVINIYGGVR